MSEYVYERWAVCSVCEIETLGNGPRNPANGNFYCLECIDRGAQS